MAKKTAAGYGHGDVVLRPTAAIPTGATRVGGAGYVLAHGETGHAHQLTAESDVEVYEHEGTLFLRVGPGGSHVTHEEHGLGTIDPGTYQVARQQEYDHFAEEARAVRD